MHIAIVSGFQVINNPRVVKEADALAEMGYRVTVLAAITRREDAPRIEALVAGRDWTHVPVIDTTRTDALSKAKGLLRRGAARFSREIAPRLNVEHPFQLGPEVYALLGAARRTRADLYSLHLEKALWVGLKLAEANRPYRLDIEDWYSEDGLAKDRAARPQRLIREAEHRLLHGAVHTTATSDAMADALIEAYGCPRPAVVHNSFPTTVRDAPDGKTLDRKRHDIPSITWFSQTIGPGRGLEALIKAYAGLERPVELHLRGTARSGFIESLLAPLEPAHRARVYLHEQVPQDELLSRLREHDIGYCGELSDCRSRDVTITNKAFEYMRAGLAIVASDTTGQREIAAAAPNALALFKQGDPASLAAALTPLIENPAALNAARDASVDALLDHFSWDRSKRVIQEQVANYFENCT
ncbi:glycosyltransferase [Sulfitobacter sp. JL08]|uniref:glycosyltransferase n=1 Tax=Sulfitobacter sp. JL08 TaxID=2070369 RepID=UPI0013B42391|nr:glycosyltransferase [Sulfitobacter sp. JL08]